MKLTLKKNNWKKSLIKCIKKTLLSWRWTIIITSTYKSWGSKETKIQFLFHQAQTKKVTMTWFGFPTILVFEVKSDRSTNMNYFIYTSHILVFNSFSFSSYSVKLKEIKKKMSSVPYVQSLFNFSLLGRAPKTVLQCFFGNNLKLFMLNNKLLMFKLLLEKILTIGFILVNFLGAMFLVKYFDCQFTILYKQFLILYSLLSSYFNLVLYFATHLSVW